MGWFDWLIVGLFTLGMVTTVATIGEPRPTVTPRLATFIVILDLLVIIGAITHG